MLSSADLCQARLLFVSPEGLALRWWRQAGLSIPEHLKQHDPPSPSITDNLCKWENIWAVLPPLRQSILLQMLTWPYVQQFSWEILKHLGSLCKSRAVFHSSCILTAPCLDEFVGHCARFCPHTGPCLLSLFVRELPLSLFPSLGQLLWKCYWIFMLQQPGPSFVWSAELTLRGLHCWEHTSTKWRKAAHPLSLPPSADCHKSLCYSTVCFLIGFAGNTFSWCGMSAKDICYGLFLLDI